MKKRIITLIAILIVIVVFAQTGFISWLDFLNFFYNGDDTSGNEFAGSSNVGYGGVKFNSRTCGLWVV